MQAPATSYRSHSQLRPHSLRHWLLDIIKPYSVRLDNKTHYLSLQELGVLSTLVSDLHSLILLEQKTPSFLPLWYTMNPDRSAMSHTWRRSGYLVLMDLSLLQHDAINNAFNLDLMWWTLRLPQEALEKMLGSSLCLGLYLAPDSLSADQDATESTSTYHQMACT